MNLDEVLTIQEIITILAETIRYLSLSLCTIWVLKYFFCSCGGNLLINVGPTKEGTIVPIFEERLRQLGSWLDVNGEAIYETVPWKYQNDTMYPNIWYTQNGTNTTIVYSILLKYPADTSKVELYGQIVSAQTKVTMLGYSGVIQWKTSASGPGIIIDLTGVNIIDTPSQWAWVFKLENVS